MDRQGRHGARAGPGTRRRCADALASSASRPRAIRTWGGNVVDRRRYPSAVDAIDRAVEDVLAAGLPDRWIPLDLDPANVLLDDDGNVAFIDLDDSYIGPAPLAIASFARRIRVCQRR